MKTYAEELLQEGLRKGRQEGQLGTIENFLRAGIEWSVIKEATGIDQEAYQARRRRLEESGSYARVTSCLSLAHGRAAH